MVIGVALLIVVVAIVAIYFLVEFKRFRHKFFAIFLIVLILFVYLSAMYVLRGRNIDLKTVPGFIEAVKLYFGWLSSAFGNLKVITTNAIHLDWGINETASSLK